jgi:hypothetical protein
MVTVNILLLTAVGLVSQSGSISGTVVNKTHTAPAACRTSVVLRLWSHGQFVPFRETAADAKGTFRFDGLPTDEFLYLPGANWEGVHYPGPRLLLTRYQRQATVVLPVYDAVAASNPLVVRKHEIAICPEPGAIKVTEAMLLDNPSRTTYVGQSTTKDSPPVTLQLHIPADFDRATFNEEFFGRRFTVVDNKVVTGIPWPPGQRELKFTYVLRNAQSHRVWLRPLDLPCAKVRLRVCNATGEEVACNLPRVARDQGSDATFESEEDGLAAGDLIRVELGHLRVSWMSRARWLTILVLAGLIAGASLIIRRGRCLTPTEQTCADSRSRPPASLAQRPQPECRNRLYQAAKRQ